MQVTRFGLGWCNMRRSFEPLVFLVLASAHGCSPEVACESGWCGTIVVASAPVQSLFPPTPRMDVDMGIADLLFSKLADVGPSYNTVGDDDFVPQLASSWNLEDSLTISVSINELAQWHDGTPVTARDVVFTFDVYDDPIVGSNARSRLSKIESVSARDSLTVEFRFSDYYPEQFYDAVSHMHILPAHILGSVFPEDLRSHEFTRSPVGTGPYRFVSWTPGESVELAGDSNHFLGRPGAPRIIWRAVAGPTAAIDEIIANRADFVHHVAEPADLKRLSNSQHVHLTEYPSNTFNLASFNLRDPQNPDRPHPLFGSRSIRRAVVMSVDRSALSQSVLGPYTLPCVGPVTPALWIWDDRLEGSLPYDSAQARSVFEEYGWRDTDNDGIMDRNGRSFSFELLVPPSPARARGALVLQAQLARVGIGMEIVDVDWPPFINRQSEGSFDAAYNSLGQDPSPAALATDWTEDGFDEFNVGKYSNPEYTRLVREARESTDPEASLEKWHAALRIINEDAPAIWMYVPRKFAAVHERFEGVTISPYQPWIGLPNLTVPLSRLIERDQFGVN